MDTINKVIVDGVEQELTYKPKRGIILARRVDNLLYISGHGPEDPLHNKPIYSGRVGEEYTLEEGYAAARECGVIILGALQDILGDLGKIKRMIKTTALVNCGEGFHDVDAVMDGFSDVIMMALDERGYHARTVMGTRNLPNNNITVEVEVIVEVEGDV